MNVKYTSVCQTCLRNVIGTRAKDTINGPVNCSGCNPNSDGSWWLDPDRQIHSSAHSPLQWPTVKPTDSRIVYGSLEETERARNLAAIAARRTTNAQALPPQDPETSAASEPEVEVEEETAASEKARRKKKPSKG